MSVLVLGAVCACVCVIFLGVCLSCSFRAPLASASDFAICRQENELTMAMGTRHRFNSITSSQDTQL